MNKTLLMTRCNHDDTTFYCHEWAKETLQLAKDMNFKIKDMRGEEITENNVIGFLEKKNPQLVFFYGHGYDDRICGHQNKVLIESGRNEHFLKNKIIHCLSCSSAKGLGPSSIEKGTKAFIGYENDFVFFWDKNQVAHPTRDEIAAPFFKSANEATFNILKGRTVEEAVRRTQRAFDYWITHYRIHDELLEAPQNLIGLIWDRASLTFHGDPTARV